MGVAPEPRRKVVKKTVKEFRDCIYLSGGPVSDRTSGTAVSFLVSVKGPQVVQIFQTFSETWPYSGFVTYEKLPHALLSCRAPSAINSLLWSKIVFLGAVFDPSYP